MAQDVELSSFDLRYESYRMRNAALEARLLASIVERGIDEPLEGVEAGQERILLNGFKRYRCARKLKLGHVPFVSLGEDAATGILALIRTSNTRSLGILEQARFVDELNTAHRMAVGEIAETLSCSKSWVTMRLGLIAEMSAGIRERIFQGSFPVYAYMYTLRPLMRMNEGKKQDVEEFVTAVSGKNLSVRDIERLAHGFFRGPDWFREEVRKGNLALPLQRLKNVPQDSEGCSDQERAFLRNLEIADKYMKRTAETSQSPHLTSRAFRAQANLLAAGILSRITAFTHAMRELHDRTGTT